MIRRNSKLKLILGALILATTGSFASAQRPATRESGHTDEGINREVRHELLLLPWYSVFDNLAYSVIGYKVTLVGQVVRPELKDDAEAAVKRIEGVESVDNKIEVLPPSPNDDQIRRAEFRAIYGQPSLQRYAMGAVPPIHIIVKDAHVTLEGAVASRADKDIANVQANTVPGVFSVTNNLQVTSEK